MNKDYSDIIDLPHHVSKNRSPMSQGDRAAQFSSFAALTGYEDMVDEAARLTDKKTELNDPQIAELNNALNYIMDNIGIKPFVKIIYFVPDCAKAGGSYVTAQCFIRKVDPVSSTLTDTENNVYHIDSILKIEVEY